MKVKLALFMLLSYVGILSAAPFFYVTDYDIDKISIVDQATNKAVGYVDNGSFAVKHPVSIATSPDESTIYVIADISNAIFRIDPTQNKIVAQINPNGFPFLAPSAVEFTPDGTKAYVTNEGGNNVSIINVATDTVTGYVSNGGNPFNVPATLDISADGTKAYVVNIAGNNVSIINVATDTVTGYVSDGGNPFLAPSNIRFVDNTKAYVTNFSGSNVSVINFATDTVTGYISAGAHPFGGPHGIFITTNLATALIANFTLNLLSVVDIPTNTVTQYVNGAFAQPLNIGITADDKIAYVTDFVGNTVRIIELATMNVIGEVAESGFPFVGPFDLALSRKIVPPPPPPFPFPPIHLTGETLIGVAPSGINYINILRWVKPMGNVVPLFYQIYRDKALTKLAGTIFSIQPLRFDDFHRKLGQTYHYFVVAVYSDGQISAPVHIRLVVKK